MVLKQIKDLTEWTDVIVDPGNELIRKIQDDPMASMKLFIEDIAGYLYDDMCRSRMLITAPFAVPPRFVDINDTEKQVWYDYAAGIPSKLKNLGLMMKQSSEFNTTCIITDEDIERLAQLDHEKYEDHQTSFHDLPGARKWYFRELNYLIPPQLKKIGLEIFRPDEEQLISNAMIRKLARAIHSGYMKEIRDRGPEENIAAYSGDNSLWLIDFDDLPDDIQHSNIDNAHHIATKLLSIGYRIKPVKPGFEALTLRLSENEIETMAKIEHSRWSWNKRLNGWIFGNIKDTGKKTHPGLIPFEDLSEMEKEKDRELVRLIPSLLQDIGYVAYPVETERLRELSYALKPKSSIHNLLNETRKLNDEIKDVSESRPDVLEKIALINKKIEETIAEVQGSYNYARHIQKTYLPDDLYIRECFPESFVFFKPRDIVSGDFYFFNKQGSLRIIAAADCTGHGIPGALLSTIGYGITDEAVNEKGLTSPSSILGHIYSKVHRFLRRDEEQADVPDDMDIAVCAIDLDTRIIQYAGVTNPLYRISRGELKEYKAINSVDGCVDGSGFTFESIQAEKGDIIYLFSDGFSDQFGGKYHKKYQRPRFKSLLLSICSLPLSEQRDLLYEEFESWRDEKDEDQTDDILVIGVKI